MKGPRDFVRYNEEFAKNHVRYNKTLDKESDSEVRFGVTGFVKKFDGPCNIYMTSYGSRDHKFENMRQ